MKDRVLGLVDRLSARTTSGVAIFTAFFGVLAAAACLELWLGLTGTLFFFAALIAIYVVGLLSENVTRARLQKEAFVRRDNPELNLDPIKDCGVHRWLDVQGDGALPEFFERGEWRLLREGLAEKRFVLLTGKGICGKDRLAFEACAQLCQVALVACDPPRSGDDPLGLLMEDDRGFPAMEDQQILLIKDIARRLGSGCLEGRKVREWLDRNPRLSLIAVQTKHDEGEIAEGGAALEGAFDDLAAEAEVVEVRATLDKRERKRAKRTFPDLNDSELETLPQYFASGPPLHRAWTRLRRTQNVPALAIVEAVAGWRRAGVTIPAPIEFVEDQVRMRVGEVTEAEFARELDEILSPVVGRASLVYERETPGGRGFVADRIAIEILDQPAAGQPLSEVLRRRTLFYLKKLARSEVYSQKKIAEELFYAGEAALRAGDKSSARSALDFAYGLDPEVQGRIGDLMAADTDSALVASRRGDGVFQRLQPVKRLVKSRRKHHGARPRRLTGNPLNPVGWVYRRHLLRSSTRLLYLATVDLVAVAVGLFVSIEIQRLLATGDGPLSVGRSATAAAIVSAVLVVFLAFGWAGLYEKDAKRARFGGVAAAVGVLTVSGWLVSVVSGSDALIAAGAALGGGLAGLGADLSLRGVYDVISRRWVLKNSPEARVLLLGPPGAVVDLERLLGDFSRPMEVIGYLDDGNPPADGVAVPEKPRLGSIDDLDGVAQKYAIGRVILADPEIKPERRQRLADRCHERHLIVEARASLSDIRSGLSRFVLGQPVLLVPLWPLWPRNVWMFAKRVMDVALAVLLLVLLAIPMLIVAFCIRVQGGPVLVRTLRLGLGGDDFHMLRFRTSVGDRGGIDIGEPKPPESVERIRGGTLLYRSGADELPQLFNVLMGHMSLVGPRPLELRHHVYFDERQLQRYLVRPGATGPWQVSRRTSLTYDELTSLDIAYIRHWSLLSDFEILARTFLVMVTRRTVPMIAGRDDVLVDEAESYETASRRITPSSST